MNTRKVITMSVILTVVFIGASTVIYFSSNSPSVPSPEKEKKDVMIDMTTQQWKFLPISQDSNNDLVRTSVNLEGKAFADTTITVKKDSVITLRIKNLDVTHGFALDEFGINKVTPPDEVTTIKFTATKEGVFTFYCNVFCGTGHPKHQGTLIVEA